MFHVELRQFPGLARAFNLTRSELEQRILGPWVAGRPVRWDEREFSPAKAKLQIFEGPEVETLGMGRGWGMVTKDGEDVTARVLEEASRVAASPLRDLKEAVVAAAPVSLGRLPALAPRRRASERLAMCEQAVWELLHEGRVGLVRDGAPVGRDEWEAAVLAWDEQLRVVSWGAPSAMGL